MKIRRSVLIILSIPLLLFEAEAQVRKAGLNSAAFLKVGVGARNVGLGSASTSFSEDVGQMFWNPAGIALRNSSMQATLSYNKWIADLNHNAFGLSYKLEDIGTVGVGVIMFGVSGINAYRDIAPSSQQSQQIDEATSDTYNYLDLALQTTFARNFSDQLSLGVTLKYINQSIDDATESAFALDLGSVYSIGTVASFVNDWKFSARLSNLGSGIKYFDVESPIPITFSVGTSFKALKDDESGDLLIAVDATKPQDSPQLYYVGAEYVFAKMFSVRAGMKFNYTGADDGGTSTRAAINQTIEGMSFGGGVQTSMGDYGLRVDYAYTSMDILDAVHRITLSVDMK
ncbi:MAG: PorV/PorQ family protein [Ignavibacteriales bacterium]|nr:PorV/PorQ family protein [Ignavibacteriales bacterium]